MATTNLVLARHTDGRSVTEEDVKVGLTVVFPASTGGVLDFKCVSRTTDKAVFKSTNKDWPAGFEMQFNQPDFTLADFKALSEALTKFDKRDILEVTEEQRQLIRRARALGYAGQWSYTQACWTEEGISRYYALRDADRPAEQA